MVRASVLLRRFDLENGDVNDVIVWIMKKYTAWTRRDYLITLKYYLRYIGRDEEANKIRATVKKSEIRKLLPQNLLTEEEVEKLINATKNLMYRAAIRLLWEGGLRIGELLGLRKTDVVPTEYGFRIMVNGKTGVRPVPIIESAPDLAKWMEICKTDKLFPIKYYAFRMYLKKLMKKAGINKRVYPHLFRHSRATYLSKKRVGESVLKKYFGWAEDSRMPAIYIHLAGDDVEEIMLEQYKLRERKETILLCPRCRHPNTKGSIYCSRCGSPLDVRQIITYEEKIRSLIDEVNQLKKELLSYIKQIGDKENM